MKTIVGLVDRKGSLEQTVAQLQQAGFAPESISVVEERKAAHTNSRLESVDAASGRVLVSVCTADEHAPRAMSVLSACGAKKVRIDVLHEGHAQASAPVQRDRLSYGLCWSARISGSMLIGVVLSFFIGEGLLGGDMPSLSTMSLAEDLLMLALLSTLLGLILAWRWEAIGGLIIVASVLLFEGIDALASGSWRISPLNPLFLLVALLFLLDWWRNAGKDRNASHRQSYGI